MKIPGSEITMNNAPEVMNLGAKAVSEGDGVFDFEGISHADSSAVAALLRWKRLCEKGHVAFEIRNMPSGLRDLCLLYTGIGRSRKHTGSRLIPAEVRPGL